MCEQPLPPAGRNSPESRVRLIAFYLPQFHPIPENDEWWGKGFTEWSNVARAKPLFRGHNQPRLPADLGFYDLRVPETRASQAEMAQKCGIEGFCYWHYWFAGKRLLERPFDEVLKSGEPRFPFCLAWANQTWTGIWHGAPDRVLIEQTYPGRRDYESHFYTVLDAFRDERYITVEGKHLFLIQYPDGIPEARRFAECWRELAAKSGLKGLYLIGVAGPSWDPHKHGFDGSVIDNPGVVLAKLHRYSGTYQGRLRDRLTRTARRHLRIGIFQRPTIYPYEQVIRHGLPPLATDFDQFPCVMPDWDNTPRSGINGVVFHGSTPDTFRMGLSRAIEQVRHRRWPKRLLFVKSWNEWAEGNYLEPDQRFGRSYLEAIKQELADRPTEVARADAGDIAVVQRIWQGEQRLSGKARD